MNKIIYFFILINLNSFASDYIYSINFFPSYSNKYLMEFDIRNSEKRTFHEGSLELGSKTYDVNIESKEYKEEMSFSYSYRITRKSFLGFKIGYLLNYLDSHAPFIEGEPIDNRNLYFEALTYPSLIYLRKLDSSQFFQRDNFFKLELSSSSTSNLYSASSKRSSSLIGTSFVQAEFLTGTHYTHKENQFRFNIAYFLKSTEKATDQTKVSTILPHYKLFLKFEEQYQIFNQYFSSWYLRFNYHSDKKTITEQNTTAFFGDDFVQKEHFFTTVGLSIIPFFDKKHSFKVFYERSLYSSQFYTTNEYKTLEKNIRFHSELGVKWTHQF